MSRLDPRIDTFLTRCDLAAAHLGVKRSTLSTKLFNDGKRLAQIATGESDVGVNRLADAEITLDRLMLSGKSAETRVA